MTQQSCLEKALRKLVGDYVEMIQNFSISEFMKAGVDPLRISYNAELWGLENAIKKEIEHKIEMKLEDLFGRFHENYLGTVKHIPSNTKWKIVPSGVMPGIDIANEEKGWYLQIKSKHNSMNSSSAKRLAQELKQLSEENPEALFGCGWVIASPKRKCIGEKYIKKVAKVYKGKALYSFVTGNKYEMDEVMEDFPRILIEMTRECDLDGLFEKATKRILSELKMQTQRRLDKRLTIVEYLYEEATG